MASLKTSETTGRKTGVSDIICGKWLPGALIGLVLLLSALLLALLYIESNRYSEAGSEAEADIIKACDNIYPDQEIKVRCRLYDADTLLLLNKTALTGHEYRYLSRDCEKQVRNISADAQADIIIFWLRGNYDVAAYYECHQLNPEYYALRIVQNYYSSSGGTIHFTIHKSIETRDRVKVEKIEIK